MESGDTVAVVERVDVSRGSVVVDQRLLRRAVVEELSGIFEYIADIFHVGNGKHSEPSETKTLNRMEGTGINRLFCSMMLSIIGSF